MKTSLQMFNATTTTTSDKLHFNDLYYNSDSFPSSSYEDEQFDSSSSILLNHSTSSYHQLINQTLSKTSLVSVESNSSPLTYLLTIVVVYIFLTVILLSFSLYKQRQTEMENFYFGDNDEEIEQGKRSLLWKRFLIGKIRKGDMKPLFNNNDDQLTQNTKYPLETV